MTKEEKIYDLVITAAQQIQKTNQYASGKYYDTDIGKYYQDWMGDVNPESAQEAFEVRDVSAEASEEQYPFQKEALTLQFVYGCKYGNNTATQLRKAKADIYRMIGANLDSWRAQVGGELHPIQEGWEKKIKHEKEIFGEIVVTITFEFITENWLIQEPTY